VRTPSIGGAEKGPSFSYSPGITKESTHVRVAFDVGLLREIEIAAVGLGLARKGVLEILMLTHSVYLTRSILRLRPAQSTSSRANAEEMV
jgi:hypothetical protein